MTKTLYLPSTDEENSLRVRNFKLLIVNGQLQGRELKVNKERFSIGSGPANDLILEDATVSRAHSEIQSTSDGYAIRDLGSTNGTIIQGVKVSEAFLMPGTEFQLGNARASVLLPQKKEIPALLTNISALGTNSGLNMARFSPRPERKKEFYAEIPVSLNIKGPYHNIGTFLYEVSKLDRIVSAINISLGSPKMQRGEMLLSSSINLITYRFLDESEIAAQTPQKGKKGKKGVSKGGKSPKKKKEK